MQQALAECEVVGVTTNAAFLRRLVMTDSFTQAKLDTALIEREQAALAPNDGDSDPALWALAAIAGVATSEAARRDARDPHSPWQAQ
ncbi:MAG TPA: 3-methylcrotonyl-CoA carboxylase, partial [Stenotrophomonas sp.]|nr:3-methylcrotonyl-CoA carboxylase [Stenotrophomonas sp.]